MCGIAGFISLDPSEIRKNDSETARRTLGRMMDSVMHRGPDNWGMAFFDFPGTLQRDENHITYSVNVREWFPVALGHRRLSIVDLSDAGQQPMHDTTRKYWIIFNGEIYNYLELRAELAEEYEFRTQTDTEVLLAAYSTWGMAMMSKLDGMFAFALLDQLENRLIFARDPLGIKPLYYGINDRVFYFGSEPKTILTGMNTTGRVDGAHLAEYLLYAVSDYDDGTFYQEVKQLPGGCWMEISANGEISGPIEYWSPDMTLLNDTPDLREVIQNRLETAILRQLRADVPVGSALSGGIDSGVIVSLIGRMLAKKSKDFKALTLINEGQDYDESSLAELTAQKAGVQWVPAQQTSSDLKRDVETLMLAMGEPFTSLSMLGQHKVMETARQNGITVMLDGQGGDEVFVGYHRLAMRIVSEYISLGKIREAWQEFNGLRVNASLGLSQFMLTHIYNSTYKASNLRNRWRLRDVVDHDLLMMARPEIGRRLHANVSFQQSQYNDLRYTILPRLLRYEDRNSMHFSIESRVPLLSVPVVELGLKLPLSWKVRNGWTKYALRKVMEPHMPPEVAWGRRKLGFPVPQKNWVEHLKPHIRAWFGDLPSGSPLNRQKILRLVDSDYAGQHTLWRLICTSLWIRATGVDF